MKKSRYTEEQIAFALKQAETGTPVAEVIRPMGVSEQTFYRYNKVYGGLGVGELRCDRIDPPCVLDQRINAQGFSNYVEHCLLPPYSPDLSPVGQAFAKLERPMRNAAERSHETTWRRDGSLLDSFSPDEWRNYIGDAGYASADVIRPPIYPPPCMARSPLDGARTTMTKPSGRHRRDFSEGCVQSDIRPPGHARARGVRSEHARSRSLFAARRDSFRGVAPLTR